METTLSWKSSAPKAMRTQKYKRRLMFEIYLPIAEMSVNLLVLLGMGGAVGFLSGMFGVVLDA